MSRGYEMGAKILDGLVKRDENGSWTIDGRPFEEWLRSVEGRQVVIVASEVQEDGGDKHACTVCGTVYEGSECPRCRLARSRLRGRN